MASSHATLILYGLSVQVHATIYIFVQIFNRDNQINSRLINNRMLSIAQVYTPVPAGMSSMLQTQVERRSRKGIVCWQL